jgi:predicted MFS family arabinose efflux permease
MLFLPPIVLDLSMLTAVIYGCLYLVFTTISEMYESQCGISSANVGLTYLGIGFGQFMGIFLFGYLSDELLKKMAKGGETKPEYRLPHFFLLCFSY